MPAMATTAAATTSDAVRDAQREVSFTNNSWASAFSSSGTIRKQVDTLACCRCAEKGEVQPLGAILEQSLALAQHQRIHDKAVLVDQAMGHQRVDQPAAAVNEDVVPRLLLQISCRLNNVALEEGGIPFQGLGRVAGRDKFLHAVHLVGERVAGSKGPRCD